jgi:glucan biosynthesis protein C
MATRTYQQNPAVERADRENLRRSDGAQPTARLHGLDALRAGALLLGIVLHALLPFQVETQWAVADGQSSVLVGPVVNVIHLFRMTLFMALAGYFGAMVLRKRGSRPYLRDRTKRILLPAIAFYPIAVVSVGVLTAWNAESRHVPQAPVPEGMGMLFLLMPGVLWFLWTLMECAVIVVVVRAVLIRMLGDERAASIAKRCGALLSAPFGVVLAAVPYAAGLVLQGNLAGGILAPLTIVPEVSSLIPYLGAFLSGWMLFLRRDGLDRLATQWAAHLVLAAASTAIALSSPLMERLPLPVGAAVTALAGWSWVYGLLGASVRFLRKERPALRYLADASYWAYLLHLPLLLLIEIPIADQPWPILAKLGLTLGVTGLVLLVSYHLLVRSTWLGRWLNGRSYPLRWRC